MDRTLYRKKEERSRCANGNTLDIEIKEIDKIDISFDKENQIEE